MEYEIYGINGPIVTVKGSTALQMSELVYAGDDAIAGEVISIDTERTVVQVYEDTSGISPGEKLISTGAPLSLALGPGLMGNIYDGIARPLRTLAEKNGAFLSKGVSCGSVDESALFDVSMKIKTGDRVTGGQIFATCPETAAVEHRAMIPPGVSGEVVFAEPDGRYDVTKTLAVIRCADGTEREISLRQYWPIRTPRPVKERLAPRIPLITGLRVIDTLFPIAKGGCAVIPGGFGTGKTVTQHAIAKNSDADVIIYVGCGERGNEMTQALSEFAELIDPRTGRSMLERTILIANTSNMPVAAREASIYTGITLAEYYRDMGYAAVMLADSTSRWAEALREISGRLEEMPADEGYPAYLPSRLSAFYERAGRVEALSSREGSVTVVGAVSPQGADFSEPVTQNTKRFTRCFWALDKSLAYARHYPAINWTDSYSEYVGDLSEWYRENVGAEFLPDRARISELLLRESKLLEVVKLIGQDVLPDDQKLILEICRIIRVGFLQQDTLSAEDASTPLDKEARMIAVVLRLYDAAQALTAKHIPMSSILATGIFAECARMRYDSVSDAGVFDRLEQKIEDLGTAEF